MGVKIAKKDFEFLQAGRPEEVYSDFVHTFLPHPHTAQITRKVNVEAVKHSLRNIIFTNKYERLRNPAFGSNLTRYLFEPLQDYILSEIEDNIEETIKLYEPRVNVTSVKATSEYDDNTVNVTIRFYVLTSQTEEEVDIVLYRVR
jgi:phage baseplate assembly protein W